MPNPNAQWRKYLDGSYIIENPLNRNQMEYNIRQKAKQMMKDLLLICQKMPKPDRVRIFHDEDVWDSVVMPLYREFQNNVCILSPETAINEKTIEIHRIAKGCSVYGTSCVMAKLFDDNSPYRSQIKVRLYNKMLDHYHYDRKNKDNPKNKKAIEQVDKAYETIVTRKELETIRKNLNL
jgi:hypothetical protein